MVDYWPTNIIDNPRCPHGPTLLFSRKNNGRKFFACSAFRDRKKCSFFQWYGTSNKKLEDFNLSNVKCCQSSESDIAPSTCLTRTSGKNFYCFTCDVPIKYSEKKSHENHSLSDMIKFRLRPTSVIKLKEESKGESQYHFCDSTVNALTSFFHQLKIFSVLCIGCPSLHEHLLNNESNINSLLLDIDERYGYVYDQNQFQPFNMFNCYFFNSSGQKYVESFLQNDSQLAIIVDPPFGGRIEALEYTVKRLISFRQNYNGEYADALVLFISPYFMETAIQNSFPTMSMLDYQVEYRNHRRFRKRRGNMSDVKGSPVRIFTNLSPSKFILPPEEGYKYCAICDRWVHKQNKHCFKCNTCTSKNGGRYRHCNICDECVKITWKHCTACKICKLSDHDCSSVSKFGKNPVGKKREHHNRKECFSKKRRKS